MKKLTYILALLCVTPLMIRAEQPTNLRVLEQMYFDICQDVIESRRLADSSYVIEKSATESQINWLIEKQFFLCLNESGIKHVYSGADDEKNAARISYQSVEQRIFYRPLAGKNVERHIDVQMQVRFIDSNKTILKDEIFSNAFKDTLAAKEITKVENPKLAFTLGERNRPFFKKIYEPILVSLLTGWIIYLFYSYRSQ